MIDLVKSHTVIAQDYFTIFWRTLGDGRRKPPGFYELLVGDLSYRVLIVCVFIIKLFFFCGCTVWLLGAVTARITVPGFAPNEREGSL